MTTKNFSTSKIYKIEPNVKHEEHEIYIGSTTKQYLSQRMTAHRSNYDCWKRGLLKKMTTSYIYSLYYYIIRIRQCEVV